MSYDLFLILNPYLLIELIILCLIFELFLLIFCRHIIDFSR